MSPKPRFRRVAIVGSGPAGLASAKALASEPVTFSKIDIYERQGTVGGLWIPNPIPKPNNVRPMVPSTRPDCKEYCADPVSGLSLQTPAISPVYRTLETNLFSSIMEFADCPFDRDIPIFPSAHHVYDYLEKYAKTIPKSVNFMFNTTVLETFKRDDEWIVKHRPTNSTDLTAETAYDALVVCNGHFEVGNIPNVPGLTEWNQQYPNTITHAKYYDDPEQFRGMRVLVVGRLSSGFDIASQLTFCAAHVYVSTREVSDLVVNTDLTTFIPEVALYKPADRSITTIDAQVIDRIDAIIFCTGYLFSIPFLAKAFPELIAPDGLMVRDLYKQMFYIPDPSLAFVALPYQVLPLPLSELQAAVIARYLSGRLCLPTAKEMHDQYAQELEERGTGKSFHALASGMDIQYAQELQRMIDDQKARDPGLVAPIWDEQQIQDRLNTGTYKKKRMAEVMEHMAQLRLDDGNRRGPLTLPPQKRDYRID